VLHKYVIVLCVKQHQALGQLSRPIKTFENQAAEQADINRKP
jgi:hypothetical protein